MTGRYYAKLGILSTIKDEDEDEDEEGKSRGTGMRFDSPRDSDDESDEEDNSAARKDTIKQERKFKAIVEKFLQVHKLQHGETQS